MTYGVQKYAPSVIIFTCISNAKISRNIWALTAVVISRHTEVGVKSALVLVDLSNLSMEALSKSGSGLCWFSHW